MVVARRCCVCLAFLIILITSRCLAMRTTIADDDTMPPSFDAYDTLEAAAPLSRGVAVVSRCSAGFGDTFLSWEE